ncbi:MAG: polysaccharide biosynthesis/export family protein [Verrucomicrobiota bacterium]
MNTLVRISAFLACALLTGCGGAGSNSNNALPAPVANADAIRAGDKITIQLTGVPDGGFFVEKEIPANGQFSLPLLNQPIEAIGKTTAELTTEITGIYRAQKIYTNPVVQVLAEERYIIVNGDVRAPSNVVYRPGPHHDGPHHLRRRLHRVRQPPLRARHPRQPGLLRQLRQGRGRPRRRSARLPRRPSLRPAHPVLEHLKQGAPSGVARTTRCPGREAPRSDRKLHPGSLRSLSSCPLTAPLA